MKLSGRMWALQIWCGDWEIRMDARLKMSGMTEKDGSPPLPMSAGASSTTCGDDGKKEMDVRWIVRIVTIRQSPHAPFVKVGSSERAWRRGRVSCQRRAEMSEKLEVDKTFFVLLCYMVNGVVWNGGSLICWGKPIPIRILGKSMRMVEGVGRWRRE